MCVLHVCISDFLYSTESSKCFEHFVEYADLFDFLISVMCNIENTELQCHMKTIV